LRDGAQTFGLDAQAERTANHADRLISQTYNRGAQTAPLTAQASTFVAQSVRDESDAQAFDAHA